RGDRHRCGPGLPLAPTVSVPLLHARRGPLWPAVPEQPGPAAADRRGPDLSAAEDREGERQSAASAGTGGGRSMNAVAAVTGGSAGIGKAICADLLQEGYEVVSLARRPCDIDNPRLHSIEVDLTDRAATAEAVAAM